MNPHVIDMGMVMVLGFALLGASSTSRGSLMEDFGGQLVDVVRLGTQEPAQVLSTIPLFILAGCIMSRGTESP